MWGCRKSSKSNSLANLTIPVDGPILNVPAPCPWAFNVYLIIWGKYLIDAKKNVYVCTSMYVLVCTYLYIFRGFTKIVITVACSLQFHWCLRTLSLKFQKARTKIEVFLSLPCWLSQFSHLATKFGETPNLHCVAILCAGVVLG